jgi:hypothetical protein
MTDAFFTMPFFGHLVPFVALGICSWPIHLRAALQEQRHLAHHLLSDVDLSVKRLFAFDHPSMDHICRRSSQLPNPCTTHPAKPFPNLSSQATQAATTMSKASSSIAIHTEESLRTRSVIVPESSNRRHPTSRHPFTKQHLISVIEEALQMLEDIDAVDDFFHPYSCAAVGSGACRRI